MPTTAEEEAHPGDPIARMSEPLPPPAAAAESEIPDRRPEAGQGSPFPGSGSPLPRSAIPHPLSGAAESEIPDQQSEADHGTPVHRSRRPIYGSGGPFSSLWSILKGCIDEYEEMREESKRIRLERIRQILPRFRGRITGKNWPRTQRLLRNQDAAAGRGVFRGYGGPWYRVLSREEISLLKEEMQRSSNILKDGSKLFLEASEEMRLEQQKMKNLVEDFSQMLKQALDTEVACLNFSKEHAAELKSLVEEMREAFKASKVGKKFNLKKIQEYARLPSSCAELAVNLSFFAGIVTLGLVAVGYIQLEDPSTFIPRDTKAGKLLNDNFSFGLNVSCVSAVTIFDTITSMLSGEVNALQSKVILKRIQDNWNCQIGLAPGHDVMLNGEFVNVLMKGLKLKYNLPLFDGLERKAEFNLKHKFGSFSGAVSLGPNPILSLTKMFGTKQLSAGVLLDYDPVPRVVRRVGVGAALDMFGVSASMFLTKLFRPQPAQPVLHQLSTSLHYQKSEKTAVCAQITYSSEDEQMNFAVGAQHDIDDSTFIKGNLTSDCVFTGLLQHKLGEKSSVSVCTSFNLRALHAVPRIGFSVSVKP